MRFPCPVCATAPFSGKCPRCGYSERKASMTLSAGGGGSQGPNAAGSFNVQPDFPVAYTTTFTWVVPADPPVGGPPASYMMRCTAGYELMTEALWAIATAFGGWTENTGLVGSGVTATADSGPLGVGPFCWGVRYKDQYGNLGTIASKVVEY